MLCICVAYESESRSKSKMVHKLTDFSHHLGEFGGDRTRRLKMWNIKMKHSQKVMVRKCETGKCGTTLQLAGVENQNWTGHCVMARPPGRTQAPHSKKIKKFPKLLNYPKRICNNPNSNLAMLQFLSVLNYFTGVHRACCSEII